MRIVRLAALIAPADATREQSPPSYSYGRGLDGSPSGDNATPTYERKANDFIRHHRTSRPVSRKGCHARVRFAANGTRSVRGRWRAPPQPAPIGVDVRLRDL